MIRNQDNFLRLTFNLVAEFADLFVDETGLGMVRTKSGQTFEVRLILKLQFVEGFRPIDLAIRNSIPVPVLEENHVSRFVVCYIYTVRVNADCLSICSKPVLSQHNFRMSEEDFPRRAINGLIPEGLILSSKIQVIAYPSHEDHLVLSLCASELEVPGFILQDSELVEHLGFRIVVVDPDIRNL